MNKSIKAISALTAFAFSWTVALTPLFAAEQRMQIAKADMMRMQSEMQSSDLMANMRTARAQFAQMSDKEARAALQKGVDEMFKPGSDAQKNLVAEMAKMSADEVRSHYESKMENTDNEAEMEQLDEIVNLPNNQVKMAAMAMEMANMKAMASSQLAESLEASDGNVVAMLDKTMDMMEKSDDALPGFEEIESADANDGSAIQSFFSNPENVKKVVTLGVVLTASLLLISTGPAGIIGGILLVVGFVLVKQYMFDPQDA